MDSRTEAVCKATVFYISRNIEKSFGRKSLLPKANIGGGVGKAPEQVLLSSSSHTLAIFSPHTEYEDPKILGNYRHSQ